MTNFDIKIVSDTVCPWCYVGKKRLDKAIAAYKEKHPESNDTFSTTFYPFYLVPDAPTSSIDKREYYLSRFGEARTNMMNEKMGEFGLAEGIHFKFGGKFGHSRDSHRLVQLGKTKSPEKQTRVMEELNAAYFENEKDITSQDVLIEAGVRAGLEEAEVKEWLQEGKGGVEVDKEVQDAKDKNITAVPHFTVNNTEVGGAQESSAWVEIFEKMKGQDAST